MSAAELFHRHFAACPLVAIIRGVTPADAVETAQAIFDAGIRIIEVPLNSPDPLTSIERISSVLQERALVGAGTVLDPLDVGRVRDAGGRLIVSPNMEPQVIRTSVEADMVSCPGVFTPTEAFSAIAAGAHAIKLFPAEAASPAVVKAQRAVLPRDVPLIVVGGVAADTVAGWMDAGADGFGLGSGLYVAGQAPQVTAQKARGFVAAVRR